MGDELDCIMDALERTTKMYKPSVHEKAQLIYDALNRGCFMVPHEEEAAVAVLVDELINSAEIPQGKGIRETADAMLTRLQHLGAL